MEAVGLVVEVGEAARDPPFVVAFAQGLEMLEDLLDHLGDVSGAGELAALRDLEDFLFGVVEQLFGASLAPVGVGLDLGRRRDQLS